jgi:[acyl-carrier-protein] S-malonyltransferase
MKPATIFMFPGQGSHFLGMGKDLLDSDNRFFLELLSIASDQLKRDITPFVTGAESEGFTDAAVLQPLITAVSLGYWKLLQGEGLEPTAVMGHSLGEITSLAPAGIVSPELAVEMAAFRGQVMDLSAEKCGGGGMAVVLFSSESEVSEAIVEYGLEESLFIANYNADNQTVISGLSNALKEFDDKFTENRRAKVAPIDVAGPWHTPFIGHGRELFLEWVEKKEFENLKKDFIMNGTADFAEKSDNFKMRVADQLVKPVYWSRSLKRVVEHYDTNTAVVEVGPGKILTGLLRANGVKKSFSSVQNLNELSQLGKVVNKLSDHL